MVDVRYPVNVPETFTLRFTVKLTAQSINLYEIMILRDAANTRWLRLVLENENIVCIGSDGVVIRAPFTRSLKYDFLFVQLTQDEGSRRLSFGVEKTKVDGTEVADVAPIGKFDTLVLGDDKLERG